MTSSDFPPKAPMRIESIVAIAFTVCLLAMFGTIAGIQAMSKDVIRRQSVACISAGKSWVQNANRDYECR